MFAMWCLDACEGRENLLVSSKGAWNGGAQDTASRWSGRLKASRIHDLPTLLSLFCSAWKLGKRVLPKSSGASSIKGRDCW